MTQAARANLYNLSRFFAFVVLFVAQAIVLDWLVSSIKEMIPVHGVRRSGNEKGRKGTFLTSQDPTHHVHISSKLQSYYKVIATKGALTAGYNQCLMGQNILG